MIDLTSFVTGGFVFLFVALFVYSFVLPDPLSKRIGAWLAERKNTPKWLLVPATAFLLIGLVIMVLGYGSAIATSLARVHFEDWVIVVYSAGMALTVLCTLLILLGRRRNWQKDSPRS